MLSPLMYLCTSAVVFNHLYKNIFLEHLSKICYKKETHNNSKYECRYSNNKTSFSYTFFYAVKFSCAIILPCKRRNHKASCDTRKHKQIYMFIASRIKNVSLNEYCQGLGGMGLHGDVSSMSRFVRAVFFKEKSVCKND